MKQGELRRLLAGGEREDLDFKRDAAGVSADDFVAFANSGKPGLLLLGVSEGKDTSGKQIGTIVGCSIDDSTRLVLTNKAQSCHPPVKISIEVYHDSTTSKNTLVVSIPVSESRPHCTPKGAYLTRHETRNVPVLPQELLTIFLENESNVFAKRFADATEEMNENLDATVEEIKSLKSDVSSRIEDISSQMMMSDMTLDDTESLLRTLVRETRELAERVGDADLRMRQVIQDTGKEDHLRTKKRQELRELIKDGLCEKIHTLEDALRVESFNFNVPDKFAHEFDETERSAIAQDAFNELVEQFKQAQGGSGEDKGESSDGSMPSG